MINMIPFENIPVWMIIEVVKHTVMCLKESPQNSGASDMLIPRAIMEDTTL